ncbi:DUF6625 family protein [Paenarthrobacter sp. 22069]|uniref:DUF6625 family protein n=1 Tax=Paenarthrobacter sp. 22069 TaxID=3453864 RepID=UPI003F868459
MRRSCVIPGNTEIHDPKCLVIAVYFGQLPSYFDIFLRSIQSNHKVDFLLVTDQELGPIPTNLKVMPASLDEFRTLASSALGMEISLPRGYKACDFRPAFGHIFRDQVRGYTHWGHCDLDVIFGDILGNIPAAHFNSRTKILIRGCFALYPNTEEAANWYRMVVPGADYRRVFSTPNPFHFDESAGIRRILNYFDVPIWNDDRIFNIEWEHFRLRASGSARGFHTYVWDDGRVFEYARVSRTETVVREGLLIHLMKRRMAKPPFAVGEQRRIYIGPDGFSTKDPTQNRLTPLNRIQLVSRGAKHQWRRVRRRIAKRGQLRPLA